MPLLALLAVAMLELAAGRHGWWLRPGGTK